MKIRATILLAALLLALGCGKEDPNKNLKPIDPSTPPPKPVKEGPGGQKPQPSDAPTPVVK